ncbi:uncharacterized protein LOC142803959 isoform X2 [Rhipicephalus microplus]|uniref:uncharacterized protein LOC142803959 isoform X2 n=1 Tax=Rhipicephalus microplus TaxID=6941 RepID=UPI003F6D2204
MLVLGSVAVPVLRRVGLSVLLDVRNKGIPTFVLERLEHQLARSTHRRAPAKCHDDNWVTKKASMI